MDAKTFALSSDERKQLLKYCTVPAGKEDEFLDEIASLLYEYQHYVTREKYTAKGIKKILDQVGGSARRLRNILRVISARKEPDENRAYLVLLAAGRYDSKMARWDRILPALIDQLSALESAAERGQGSKSATLSPGRKSSAAVRQFTKTLKNTYQAFLGKPAGGKNSKFFKLVEYALSLVAEKQQARVRGSTREIRQPPVRDKPNVRRTSK